MNHLRLLLIIGAGLSLLVVGIIFLQIWRSTTPAVTSIAPTPMTPIPTSASDLPNQYPSPAIPMIKMTNPPDKQQQVPLTGDITITFTHDVQQKDIEILAEPVIAFTASVVPFHSDQVVLKLQKPLAPGVLYTLRVTYIPYPYYPRTFSFTTEGPTPSFLPDTAPNPTIVSAADRAYLDSRPDIFLTNKVPHQESAFQISSTYTKVSPGHFYFDVQLKGSNSAQSKQAFLQWLTSLGMNQDQISKLDIRYK